MQKILKSMEEYIYIYSSMPFNIFCYIYISNGGGRRVCVGEDENNVILEVVNMM